MTVMKNEEDARMLERAYKTMAGAGVTNIVVGIIMIVAGLAAGTLTVVHGARLLKNKNDITF